MPPDSRGNPEATKAWYEWKGRVDEGLRQISNTLQRMEEEGLRVHADLKHQLSEDKAEAKKDNAELRAEMIKLVGDLQTNVARTTADVRAEIAKDNAEVKTAMATDYAEIKKDVGSMKTQLSDYNLKIAKWGGALIALITVLSWTVPVLFRYWLLGSKS